MIRKASPHHARWIDRFGLWLSRTWRYDGMTVSVVGVQHAPEDLLERVTSALALLRDHDSRSYRRLKTDTDRIWVKVLVGTIGEYNEPLRTICLDERFVASPNTATPDIAATIVHEATHARLCGVGLVSNEHTRARIERLCFNRELAFANQFPESQTFVAMIERLQELPESEWSHDKLRDRRLGAAPRALKYLGAPYVITRLLIWTARMWGRLRRGRAA
jgi:hypothetical protein